MLERVSFGLMLEIILDCGVDEIFVSVFVTVVQISVDNEQSLGIFDLEIGALHYFANDRFVRLVVLQRPLDLNPDDVVTQPILVQPRQNIHGVQRAAGSNVRNNIMVWFTMLANALSLFEEQLVFFVKLNVCLDPLWTFLCRQVCQHQILVPEDARKTLREHLDLHLLVLSVCLIIRMHTNVVHFDFFVFLFSFLDRMFI